ncbi:MAG TPA: cation-translocating P-type ATPase [Actinomycetes bacterium]
MPTGLTGDPPARPWALKAEEVAGALGVDAAGGLSDAEAALRLQRYGPNELVERARKPAWRLLAEQFANTMIVILLLAAVVTLVVGDLKDTLVILAIVVLNGLIGYAQEHRAEQAMAALQAMTVPTVRVLRSGRVAEVPAAALVPGDLVQLATGDVVAADLRLVEVQALRVNEAALTGESKPVFKTTDPLPDADPAMPAEQRNLAFRGTAVTTGRGAGVVVATGMATELGRLAELLQAHPSEPTPLQRRLAVLGRWLAAACLVVCVVVFGTGIARGEPVERMFLTAVSLAVAAIPEGLPAVVTIALALGARRMARRCALVRKLPAVETLGSVTVICSDKTGTLTENRMLVERVWTPAGTYRVTGDGYAPVGTVTRDGGGGTGDARGGDPWSDGDASPDGDRHLGRLAFVAAACNDAALLQAGGPDAAWAAGGDPTEAALLALAGKLGVTREAVEREHPRVAEVGFDPIRRRMTTLHRAGDGVRVAVKGAVDVLLPLLRAADAALARRAEAVTAGWAADGYRLLALAERRLGALPEEPAAAEDDLRLLGVVAMADPPRPASSPAVASCRQAGITPVMITGDDARTAGSVARRTGILDGGEVLTGRELARLDDDGLRERVDATSVYARTNPEQKLRIVAAWKDRGAVVAMTGDGVNDAPALRRADIGVAMGVTGTDVSKEAADMVLADDDFATIVAAVEEGRRIYDNIRRFVRYLLATNSGEIWVMFLASLLALPVPLLPVQLLWVNLVTDGLPAIALGLEPAERSSMQRSPRPPDESILGRGLWQNALWVGLTMAAVCLGMLVAARAAGWPWQTMVFTTLALLQLGNALAVRSERDSFFSLGVRSNPLLLAAVLGLGALQLAVVYLPPLRSVFGTEPLHPVQLAVVLVASTTAFAAVEVDKWLRRLLARRRPAGEVPPSGDPGGR